jgi:DNA-binding CsgD family transcriptional regulator
LANAYQTYVSGSGVTEVNAQISTVVAISQLTSKQRQVLDLLLEHKTSKEIAQLLAISPHTVDQRIQFAKRRLGVTSRSELARTYRELRISCEQMTHEESHISGAEKGLQVSLQDEWQAAIDPEPPQTEAVGFSSANYRLVPELFEGQLGKWVRFISILAATFLVLLIMLGGLAAYTSLASLIAH